MAPHATLRQNEPSIAKLLEGLRSIGNAEGGGAALTKAEKLMVVNLAPTTDVELYTVRLSTAVLNNIALPSV